MFCSKTLYDFYFIVQEHIFFFFFYTKKRSYNHVSIIHKNVQAQMQNPMIMLFLNSKVLTPSFHKKKKIFYILYCIFIACSALMVLDGHRWVNVFVTNKLLMGFECPSSDLLLFCCCNETNLNINIIFFLYFRN